MILPVPSEKALTADILAIDFETTGAAKGNENLPWQLGAIRINNGIIEPDASFSLFLHVPLNHQFNPYAPGRWASIRDNLAAAPEFISLWPQLAPWLTGRALLAHHAPTERSILQKFFPLHPFGPWLDTLAMAKAAYPKLNSHKLEDIIPELHLTSQVESLAPELKPHDAFYDSCACAVLFRHILSLPGWSEATIEQLAAL
ncbi:MAG: 3'-5' exonuclease [Victivallales bacterium]|nr:3'-5' exonuclease [Victivallales bacterium]